MDQKRKTLEKKKSASIAENLLDRHQSLKRKLEKFRTKKINENLKKVQPAPKINQKSRRMASRSQPDLICSENRIKRTHEILKNSRFMPKKVKLSLDTLKQYPKTKHPSPRVLRYDMIFTTPQAQSPVTFPSLTCLTELTTPEELEYLPTDISNRNKLLMSLKSKGFDQEVEEPGYLDLPLEERTAKWLKKKQERVKTLRKERDSKRFDDCTFRPTLSSSATSKRSTPRVSTPQSSFLKKPQRTQSQASIHSGRTSITSNKSQNEDTDRVYRQFSTSGSSSVTLNNICPVSVNVSYHSGFSHSLRKKSKPMINYRVLNVKP
jgi:hypothetical protein